jgi:hypothetical protein
MIRRRGPTGSKLAWHWGGYRGRIASPTMTRKKRPRGTGEVSIKYGAFYGRWWTPAGGRTNRKLGPVRVPGANEGPTRTQAEKRMRELMGSVQHTTDPARTVRVAGRALLERLEARGSAGSHIEGVESHLRVHIVPFFGEKPLDRIDEDDDVTRFAARLHRSGRAPKTVRNIASTLHSVFELARRRRWVDSNPCALADLPAQRPTKDIRYLRHEEFAAVLDHGIPDDRIRLHR